MKTEVLQQIKKSEEEYQSLVNTARDERNTISRWLRISCLKQNLKLTI